MENNSNPTNETPKQSNNTSPVSTFPMQGLRSIKGGLLKQPYVLFPGRSISALFAVFFIGIVLLSVATYIILKGNPLSTKSMYIVTVAQDILIFIAPALVAAIMATRLPASLLALNVKPRLKHLLIAVAILIVAMPLMNYIVALNQNLVLPEFLGGLEDTLRSMEDSATEAVNQLAGSYSLPSMILGVLILGLLTGLSEELFFRGAMQNLFFNTRMKRHLAVWLVAIIFSLMHMQFYGFIPRVLLGAFFGYLIWWTGSIWIPILCHALNNSVVVVSQYLNNDIIDPNNIDYSLGQFDSIDYILIAVSVILTGFGLWWLRHLCLAEKTKANA